MSASHKPKEDEKKENARLKKDRETLRGHEEGWEDQRGDSKATGFAAVSAIDGPGDR